MARGYITKFLLACALAGTGTASAQWEEVPGPTIKVPLATQAVAVSGDTILLGTYQNTIFRSTDGGTSWSKADSGLSPSLTFWTFSFLVEGRTVYAGTVDGVYVSTNMGDSWALSNNGLSVEWGGGVYCFIKRGSRIYAGTDDGLYYTTDNGGRWSPDNAGLGAVSGAKHINALALHDSIMFAGTNDGIYRSTDGGSHWQAVNSGIPIWSGSSHADVEGILVDSSNIVIVTGGWGIFHSTDDGDTWHAQTNGLDVQNNGFFFPMTSIIQEDSTILVGTQDDGICLSTDGGNTWKTDNIGLPARSYVLSLAFEGNTLFAADFDGLFRKEAGSQTWSPVLTSFAGKVTFGSIGSGGSSLVVNAYSDYNRRTVTGVYLTANGGNSWSEDTTLKIDYPKFRTIGTRLFAMGFGLYASSDQGVTWARVDSGELSAANDIVSKGTSLFVVTGSDSWQFGQSGSAYVSTDGGATWDLAGLKDTCLLSVTAAGNAVFAGGLRSVYRSTDNGKTWSTVDNGLPPGENVTQLVSINGIVLAGTQEGIYSSNDDGQSWKPASTGLPLDSVGQVGQVVMLPVDNRIIAGTGSGIYATSNYGSTWVAADSALSGGALQIKSLAILGEDLYASTSDGIWHRPLSQVLTGVYATDQLQPGSFELYQNYPNPFNPTTAIGYQLSVVSHVTLTVYDVLGRRVRTLVDKVESPGSHEVTFDAAGLASGVYFYRLSAAAASGSATVHTKVMKLILLK